MLKSEKDKLIKKISKGEFDPTIVTYAHYDTPSSIRDQINDKSEGSVWVAELKCGHTVVTGSTSMDMVYFCKECTIDNINKENKIR